jgi:predicted ArsR family transcriptional regulator
MNANEQSISKEEALVQVRLALRRAALIYHYFAKTLIDELGEDRGRELILKAVNAYGEHIGKASRRRAQEKGLALSPQNYQEDLPKMAWEAEPVTVDGEDRTRVHHCPLAAEWLAMGESRNARLYCFVDQAKMAAFNPEFEYIHLKNMLDGDPYCEMVVRPASRKSDDD